MKTKEDMSHGIRSEANISIKSLKSQAPTTGNQGLSLESRVSGSQPGQGNVITLTITVSVRWENKRKEGGKEGRKEGGR